MFKISFYIRKKADISAQDFNAYWLGEHAELQKGYLEKLGVRCFIKSEVLPDDPIGQSRMEAYQTKAELYDFVDHWIFNDIEALKRGSENPEVQAAMKTVYDSEDRYIDTDRSSMMMVVDIAQTYPKEDIRATPESDYIKVYYCARCRPQLTRAQAQLHWNACHGAHARQEARFSPLSRYIQAHAIDSTFVNQVVAERGYEVDPNFIGHAEAWIDTKAPQKELSEEEAAEAAEIDAMSMDDIDLFVDKTISQTFVAKEHFIIDKKVIVRPMPKFFSAVY
ncbi:MAG: EthD domain-containing protein [Deltaproteobacteria bacterium]|nr:EthD domain-containing protein [Deltaproteobacteria bacterium]